MIISPPFLPTRPATEDEPTWLARAMTQPSSRAPQSNALEGSYPVSAALQWHNGLHLVAPREATGSLPVRAIADGKVIFVSSPTPFDAAPNHPQNYMPDKSAAWTDNGCVIIEHETDIGAAGATATTITYYSLYMHLSEVETAVTPNSRIYRKDRIGKAGQFYGAQGQLHFEICCNKPNLETLTGRPAAWTEIEPFVAPTANGRTDAVFGDLFVYLPASTPTSAVAPTSHLRQAGSSGATLGISQWVGIRYVKGRGALRSYDLMGQPLGILGGHPEPDFEYKLYTEATTRHASLIPTAQATSSPSGWYELLRFGRNLGPDPLPANAAHWREIPTATGTIWADLNAPGSFKFSEADFLAVMGWNFFDDDATPLDQRCDSVNLKRWIRDPDPANAHRMERTQLGERLGDAGVRQKLKRAICNFSSEWEQVTIELRMSWLREPKNSFELDSDDNWDCFMHHCQAMTFANLPATYLAATWRVDPGEFIAVMRRCGWLSAGELAQCLPRNSLSGAVTWDVALQRANTHSIPYNIFIRTFSAGSMVRYVHNLAQSFIETGLLRTLTEDGRGVNKAYGAFYGRGYHQLTWASNFKNFGAFANFPNHSGIYSDSRITKTSMHPFDSGGRMINWNPKYDPLIVENNRIQAGRGSGFYWVSKSFRGTSNINRVCDYGVSGNTVGFISWLINGGSYGYANRQQFAMYISNILLDEVLRSGTSNFTYPNLSEALTSHFPLANNIPQNQTGTVIYVQQKP